MKRILICGWLVGVAVFAAAGCYSKSSESDVTEELVEIGPKYSAKDGLFVPDETRRSLGLKVVEVTEQKVPATLAVQLRVYQEDKNSILASATITPEEAKLLKHGQIVQAHTIGATGTVADVNIRLQQAVGNAEVLVKMFRSDLKATVGAFVPATVTLESEATVVSVPRSALLECSDGHSVYTVSGDSFVRTPVKVGARTDDLVEIKDGLFTGDQVVTQPVMSLWMTELAAVKGGQACCVAPAKGK